MSDSSSSPHVAIDMTSLRPAASTASATTATISINEPHEVPTSITPLNRSRSRSRSRTNRGSSSSSPARAVRSNRSSRDLRLSQTDAEPLLPDAGGDAEMIPRKRPPLVHPETEDDDDGNVMPNTPQDHPGVDGGFFPSVTPLAPVPDDDHPLSNPDDGEGDSFDGPHITTRLGDDDDDNNGGGGNDRTGPSARRNGGVEPPVRRQSFPFAPGLDGTAIIVPDVNVYQQKKTLAQGMMDLALLSANANQLRYVLESYNNHPYFYASLTFITISIILQIAVGVGLIWNSRYNVKNQDDICKADRINNCTVIGIFLITTVNVFITSFGVASREQPLPIRQ